MAIIQCPECGQNISDKSSKCIHCGKVSKKTKKIAIISIVAIIFCTILIFAIRYIGDMNAKKEFVASYNAYIDNMETVQVLTITGGIEAETLCNLTYSVWRNAIYEDRDSATDPYTRPNGYWVGDFNEALLNLYEASSTTTTISIIEENQTSIKEIVKNLQNPPEGLEKCYDTLSDLYSAYKSLTDLAISPSGNITEFSEKKDSDISDFMDAYEKLDNQIPERKTDK